MAKMKRKLSPMARNLLTFFAIFLTLAPLVLISMKFDRELHTSCEQVRREILKYNWDYDIALAIAEAESGCYFKAKGDTDLTFQGCYEDLSSDLSKEDALKGYRKVECSKKHKKRTYGYSVGVFQIRILPGRTECDTFDLATNVKCAYRVYQEKRGFTPWSVYNDGKYRKFLPAARLTE